MDSRSVNSLLAASLNKQQLKPERRGDGQFCLSSAILSDILPGL